MEIVNAPLAGIKLITPRVFTDDRGHFLETYQSVNYPQAGLDETFVQDNLSHSRRGVLRGLHYQYPNAQGKLVYVVQGEIFDAVVDIRRDSPTFGKWFGVVLSARDHRQLYVAPGFAHGFCALSETADVVYKCTAFYSPADEHTLRWDDPTVGVQWPIAQPILSPKDAQGKSLHDCVLPA